MRSRRRIADAEHGDTLAIGRAAAPGGTQREDLRERLTCGKQRPLHLIAIQQLPPVGREADDIQVVPHEPLAIDV